MKATRMTPLIPLGLCLYMLFAVSQAADVPLLNFSFEEAAEGPLPQPKHWQGSVGNPNTYDVTEHDAKGAADGSFALLCGNSDFAAVSQLTQTPLTPGVTYTLSAKFLPRVSRDAAAGGYWLRLLARNSANPTDAHIVSNVFGPTDELTPGEWVSKELTWTAPDVLSGVPVISNGITGAKPDGVQNLSGQYVLEVLVGGSLPSRQPDEPHAQTWIDAVQFSTSN